LYFFIYIAVRKEKIELYNLLMSYVFDTSDRKIRSLFSRDVSRRKTHRLPISLKKPFVTSCLLRKIDENDV